MARPWSRKGGDRDADLPDAGEDDDGAARLDADEHAWWARSEVAEPWAPRRSTSAGAEPERDILAEHFGADWRTSFGFTPPADAPAADGQGAVSEGGWDGGSDGLAEIDTTDPYAVLDVDRDASWEDIVAAHRREARRHHPDRLVDQPAATVAAAEDRIRHINAAYQELRVRRGR